MSYWEALLFGFVQGLTEFLPISSSAHIVITQHLLGLSFPGLAFEIFLHLASITAVVFYFRKDLVTLISGFLRFVVKREPADRVHFLFGLYIVVATLITGVLGVLFEGLMGDSLKSPVVIALALATTGIFLILIERGKTLGGRGPEAMRWSDSIIVGLAQTVAVLPGISRSGSTLVAALWCGLERETAVRYSFLLAIPVILGSVVLALGDVDAAFIQELGAGPLLLAFLSSLVFSVVGIIWLIAFLKRSKLIYFALYCFAMAAFVFFYFDPSLHFDTQTPTTEQPIVIPE